MALKLSLFEACNKGLDSSYILLIAFQKLNTKSSCISRPSSYAPRTLRHAIDDPRSALKTFPTGIFVVYLLSLNAQYFFYSSRVCYQRASKRSLKSSTPLDIENGQCVFTCTSLCNSTQREREKCTTEGTGTKDICMYIYIILFFFRQLAQPRKHVISQDTL